MNPDHAGRNAYDRSIGEGWESRFCEMATGYGFGCRAVPQTRWFDRIVTIDGREERHELKHKKPTWEDRYGLEQYRFKRLLQIAEGTSSPMLYTIHDWALAGATTAAEMTPNRIEDWYTVDVRKLRDHQSDAKEGKTYYGGEAAQAIIYYWPVQLWDPLAWQWSIDIIDKREQREAAWAIVKDTKGMVASGHEGSVRWARAVLELE